MKKKSHKIKHAVVLVNYKVSSDTIISVKSIQKTKDAPHIIVVDSGSSQAVIQELRDACPGLDIVVAGANVGFSVGNNLGIKKALKMGAQVVYILNNDTEVDPNLFFRAYRYTTGKNRIVGGKIYYAKGREFHPQQKGQGNILWYAGGYFDWNNVIARHIGVDEVDQGQHDKIRPVEFITGCFIAVPKQVFKKIGLLDESLFLYLEDVDFCLRAKLQGIEVIYNSKLVIYHHNSSSTLVGSPLVDYYLTRNRFVICQHYGTLRLRFALLREAILRNWNSPIRRLAFLDYLWGRMGNRHEEIFTTVAKIRK